MSHSARPFVRVELTPQSVSSDEEDDSETHIKISQAASLLRDAVDGFNRPVPIPGRYAYCALALRNRLLLLLQIWSLAGMFVEFFVLPDWCVKSACWKEDTDRYFMSHVPKFSRRSSGMRCADALYIIPFVADGILQINAFGRRIFENHPAFVVYVCCVGLCCVTTVAEDLLPASCVLPILRAGIFVYFFPSVAKQVQIVARSLKHVIELLALGALLMAFFAWMALILYPPYTEEGRRYFPAFLPGMWSLFVLLTTANFPDVMLPAYEKSRSAVVFFVVFMLVGMFFLVNVITAMIMSAYQRQVAEDTDYRQTLRREKVSEAFDLLSADGPLTVVGLEQVFLEMGKYADLDHVLSENMKQESPCWKKAKDCAENDRVGWIIDLGLAINFILLLVEMWPVVVGSADGDEAKSLTIVIGNSWRQTFFTWLFILECVAKIALLGIRRYLSVHFHRMDLAVTVAVAGLSFLIWCPFVSYADWKLLPVLTCLRLSRLFRLLNNYKPYKDLAHITFLLLPTALDILLILALLCYLLLVFSAIGVSLFGGLIDKDPTGPHYTAVAASTFGQAGYWANNFNDFGMGFVTLFELLVVNNWFVISDGFSAAAGVWARAYFVVFYILGVLVGLNLVVSFIIGAYMNEYEETLRVMQAQQKSQEEEFRLKDQSESCSDSDEAP
ncbi:TPC1 [Symbiodinium pilosum]|uniref:TPC1 protein n=1 Tax=Symbiodinium pilosum TaxID=2952 RepID=A0A812XMH3_SYMPI|nr:TPC1 [Symbiodinium pilosum]